MVSTEKIQQGAERSSENLKGKKKPSVWELEENDLTYGSQRAYEWIMVRIEKVKEDYQSAVLTWNDSNSLERKREGFLKIGRECCSIEAALQGLGNPHLEVKAAEKLLPVCSNVRKWIEGLKDLFCSSEDDANIEPRETAGIGVSYCTNYFNCL